MSPWLTMSQIMVNVVFHFGLGFSSQDMSVKSSKKHRDSKVAVFCFFLLQNLIIFIFSVLEYSEKGWKGCKYEIIRVNKSKAMLI